MSQRSVSWRQFCEACAGLPIRDLETIAAPFGTLLAWSMADSVPGAVYAAIVAQSGAAPQIDPQAQWLVDHPEEARSYQGKFLAVHETRGIIAAASGYTELLREIEHELDGEIVIEFIG